MMIAVTVRSESAIRMARSMRWRIWVGDIATSGDDTDPPIVTREDGSWLIDGMVPLDEVKDVIGRNQLPGDESGDFHTLGGFMMAQIGRVPKVADHVTIDGYRFEIVDMDGRRVDRVLIAPPKGKARVPAAAKAKPSSAPSSSPPRGEGG